MELLGHDWRHTREMRTKRSTVIGVWVAVVVLSASACSSGGRDSSSTTTERGSVLTTASGSSESRVIAVALARRMLDAVWLPPGSRPFSGVPPANLHAADTFPFTPNLVLAHRLWTVN